MFQVIVFFKLVIKLERVTETRYIGISADAIDYANPANAA